MSDKLKAIGSRIAGLRHQARLTQQELADIIGVARATIATIETGAERAGVVTTLAIADYFRVSMDWLLCREHLSKAAIPSPLTTVPEPEAEPDKIVREAQRQFAASLRQARLQYGKATNQGEITQREFAMMLGIDGERPEERYRLYEAAKREPPLWILAALRRVTGYSLDSLIAQLPAGRPLAREQTAPAREAAE